MNRHFTTPPLHRFPRGETSSRVAKCRRFLRLILKLLLHCFFTESGNIHYGGGGPNVHIHALTGHHPLHCMTPGMVATVVFCTIVGLIAVAGICWLIALLV